MIGLIITQNIEICIISVIQFVSYSQLFTEMEFNFDVLLN